MISVRAFTYWLIEKKIQFRNRILQSQRLFREITPAHNDGVIVKTEPGATGILRYLINDIYEIRELQKNTQINVGDKVVTSGFSKIYP